MSKRLIIGVIVAFVLIGGGVFFATREDNNKTSNNSSANISTEQASDSAGFAPVSTEGLAFSADITLDGQTQATIQSDGKGNISYSSTQNGQDSRVVYTPDTYYVCTGDSCFKYAIGTSSPVSFNPSDYQYTKDQLSGYQSNAVNKGRQSCPAGTCDVWSVTNAGVTSNIFIDTNTKRINQVESSTDGKTTRIVYDYKTVVIDVPTNAQSLPIQ